MRLKLPLFILFTALAFIYVKNARTTPESCVESLFLFRGEKKNILAYVFTLSGQVFLISIVFLSHAELAICCCCSPVNVLKKSLLYS